MPFHQLLALGFISKAESDASIKNNTLLASGTSVCLMQMDTQTATPEDSVACGSAKDASPAGTFLTTMRGRSHSRTSWPHAAAVCLLLAVSIVSGVRKYRPFVSSTLLLVCCIPPATGVGFWRGADRTNQDRAPVQGVQLSLTKTRRGRSEAWKNHLHPQIIPC